MAQRLVRCSSEKEEQVDRTWGAMGRVAWLGAVIVATSFAATTARADTPVDARDLFARGRDLRAHGDCTTAVAVFRRAYEVYPAGLGSLRNIAECEESMGHFASARRAWLDLKRALLANRDAKYEGWAEDAEQGDARLAAKVATLTIGVDVVTASGETVPGEATEVTINGEPLTSGLVGMPLERDPGRYIVRVASGRAAHPEERVVELGAGDARRVTLRLVVAAHPPAASEAATSAPRGEMHAQPARRTAAWIAMGIGAVGLVGAGIALGVYESNLGALQDVCGSTASCASSLRARAQPIEDRGNTAGTLVNVFGAVGLIGAASGIVLFATSSPQSARTALVVSPMGVSAIERF
jgi:hypothetical protein